MSIRHCGPAGLLLRAFVLAEMPIVGVRGDEAAGIEGGHKAHRDSLAQQGGIDSEGGKVHIVPLAALEDVGLGHITNYDGPNSRQLSTISYLQSNRSSLLSKVSLQTSLSPSHLFYQFPLHQLGRSQ